MPQTGVLTPTNLGISTTRPCSEQQVSQSLSNIANNLINLQTQIGDPSTLPPIISQIPGLDGLPGGPGGPGTSGTDGPAGTSGIDLTSLLKQILQTIKTIIEGGGGGGGAITAYGGLVRTGNNTHLAGPDTTPAVYHLLEFDSATALLEVTSTVTSASKLTVHSNGDYLLTFHGTIKVLQDSGSGQPPFYFRPTFRLYINGAGATPEILGTQYNNGINYDASTPELDCDISFSTILSLSASDTVQIKYAALVSTDYANIVQVTTPATDHEVVTGATGTEAIEVNFAQLNLVKLN